MVSYAFQNVSTVTGVSGIDPEDKATLANITMFLTADGEKQRNKPTYNPFEVLQWNTITFTPQAQNPAYELGWYLDERAQEADLVAADPDAALDEVVAVDPRLGQETHMSEWLKAELLDRVHEN